MAQYLTEISVIIPVRDTGEDTQHLRDQLENAGAEVLISSEGTRAKSMNMGARHATRKYLWFLHADSTVTENHFKMLQNSLQHFSGDLHYFDLAFDHDGSRIMCINALGANMRSRLFGTPFGDQGLCIRKDHFFGLNGYDESATYGEDHLFVWHARRRGIKLKRVPIALITSARTYTENGWLKITLRYQYLWIKQALPQWWVFIQGK